MVLKNNARFTDNTGAGMHFKKLRGSNLQSNTPAQAFSCKFYKNFKNNFFTKQLQQTASVILTFLEYDFHLLCTFHQPSLILKEFTKLYKFGIVKKLPPSGASRYNFSLNRRK